MDKNHALAQTHYFQFVPEHNGQGIYEYCMSSKVLFNPEDTGLGIFAAIIAGLGPEDVIRIKIHCFSNMVVGEIYLICSLDKPLPEKLKRRNRKALKTAEKFAADIQEQGFSKEKVEIKEGESPLLQPLMKNSATHTAVKW